MSTTADEGTVTSGRPREQWTGQFGFIMSAIGSAVGLGNIWRFPGVAYENGGGAFLIPYLVALLTAGIPILFLDYAIGHRFRGSPPTALKRLGGRFGRWVESLGWFQVLICFIIAVYYTAVIAWALSYFVFSFDLKWGDDTAGFFSGDYLHDAGAGFSLSFVPSVVIPLVIVWILALVVLGLGVAKGLQRVNVIGIPLLTVGFVILVVRALFLDGAADGLNALFTPDWQALGDPSVWIAAYSQIFFSLSIAFGIMITYSSYRKRRSNMTTPGLVVAFANSSFELLAGIGVFATLGFFAFQQGIDVSELDGLSGVALSFITFPAIISQMPAGFLFGALFFGALALAGFTSLISILQVVAAAFQEKFAMTRRSAVLTIGIIAAIVSVALFSTTTGLTALDTIDQWANNIGIVASAVLMTVIAVWIMRRGRELAYHLTAVSTFHVRYLWLGLVGVLSPIVLAYMLIERIIELITEGYSDLPSWYILTFGWGAILFAVVASIVLTAVPWRREAGLFTAWPPYRPTTVRGGAAPVAAADRQEARR